MSKEKLQYTNGNYFCSSEVRPDCIRGKSKGMQKLINDQVEHTPVNFCCLFCDIINQCIEKNKSKCKPCTANIVSPDEHCPYSI